MGTIYFGDVFSNNLADFWNNSTKFDKTLDMSKYIFLQNSRAPEFITWQLLAFKHVFKSKVNFDLHLRVYLCKFSYKIWGNKT